MDRVNYDRFAGEYDRRYRSNLISGVAEVLRPLATCRVLEAGCGTGRWLGEMSGLAVGLDYSIGMLKEAQKKGAFPLVQGTANQLPFAANTFQLVYCVNAIHHFDDARSFLREAARVAKAIAVVGIEPRLLRDRWWVYEYFKTTWDTDLKRFPSEEQIIHWMQESNLQVEAPRLVESIHNSKKGREILSDPFLGRESNSQLALLSDEEYENGMQRIRGAAEAGAVFRADLDLRLIYGKR